MKAPRVFSVLALLGYAAAAIAAAVSGAPAHVMVALLAILISSAAATVVIGLSNAGLPASHGDLPSSTP
jgi:hypothetical protein